MSENSGSIHDFDINLICEYFSSMERQGPGSQEATLKALSFIEGLNEHSTIADLGCGTGGQSLELAKHIQGQVIGIDLFPVFIDIFNDNARKQGLENRLIGQVGSMDSLNFKDGELDAIWCEGAIYNIGYQRGIQEWKRFLKEDGYLAVTEACWLTDERPKEIEDFWMDAYPEIGTISTKLDQMHQAGYQLTAHFILPEYCWLDNFYLLQKKAEDIFLSKYPDNPSAEYLVANMRHELVMYNKYSKYYGYVFFIGRKRT